MARNVPRGSFIRCLLSFIHAWRERGNCQLVSKDIGTFSTSIDVYSYSSNISNVSHTNMHCDSLSLGTPSQQFQHSNAPQHLGTLEYPYFGQPQTIYPFPANNIFLGGPQSASLPQSNLVCDPQSQEPIELDLLYPPFHANTLFGPPAEAATTSRRHEPVDQSEPRVIDGPPR